MSTDSRETPRRKVRIPPGTLSTTIYPRKGPQPGKQRPANLQAAILREEWRPRSDGSLEVHSQCTIRQHSSEAEDVQRTRARVISAGQKALALLSHLSKLAPDAKGEVRIAPEAWASLMSAVKQVEETLNPPPPKAED